MSNPLLDTTDLPQFTRIKPEHTLPALKELIAAHRQKLAALLDDPGAREFAPLVKPLEEMSHELSRVWSPVSHLQSVLDSAGWRDFRLSGVTLPDGEKARYREIMQEIAALRATFDQNVQDATDAWHFHTINKADILGIPEMVKTRAAADARTEGADGWWFKLDYPNYHAVMTHGGARSVRETFYRAWVTRASDQGDSPDWDNSNIMDRILAMRHEAANLVCFDHYADYSLATKMAGNVDEVLEFLTELALRSQDSAARELAAIQSLAEEPLAAWDVSYFLEQLKQKKFSINIK